MLTFNVDITFGEFNAILLDLLSPLFISLLLILAILLPQLTYHNLQTAKTVHVYKTPLLNYLFILNQY